jgi:hypothetical protein
MCKVIEDEKEISGEDVYNHVKNEFVEWLKKLKKQRVIKLKDMGQVYMDSYYVCRNINTGVEIFTDALKKGNYNGKELSAALDDDDSEPELYNALKEYFEHNPNKTKIPSKSARDNKKQFIYLKYFLKKQRPDLLNEVLIAARYKSKTNNEKHSVKKVEQQSKNKPMPAEPIKKSPSDEPQDIFDRAMEKIKDINRECKNRNKSSIFKSSVYEYSEEIKKSCISLFDNRTEYLYKIIFKDFISNLYIMIYETTREEKSNNTKGKPFYDYKLPDGFLNKGTTTRHFMDIVGTLRHHYAHLEPEYKESIKKISWGDVLNELLGNRNEPKSKEDFQKLQIEVLKRFEASMDKLLEIVKNELNPDKNH